MTFEQLRISPKTLRRFASFALHILLLSALSAASGAERKSYTTIGRPSCDKWTADRKKAIEGQPVDGLAAALDRAWLHGFLTALNGVVEEKKDLLAAVDSDTVVVWMDRFCARNPENNVLNGAIELFLELRKIVR